MLASGLYAEAKGASITGFCLAVGSAICYTLYNLAGEVALAEVSPLTVMSYTQLISSLGLIAFLFLASLFSAILRDNRPFDIKKKN